MPPHADHGDDDEHHRHEQQPERATARLLATWPSASVRPRGSSTTPVALMMELKPGRVHQGGSATTEATKRGTEAEADP